MFCLFMGEILMSFAPNEIIQYEGFPDNVGQPTLLRGNMSCPIRGWWWEMQPTVGLFYNGGPLSNDRWHHV
jgi:hypothetical protein